MAPTVLILDEFPIVRRGLIEILNRSQTLQPLQEDVSARDAVQHIEHLRPSVVVLDLSAEHGSGLDLIADLRNRCPDARCLIFSAYSEQVYAKRAFHAGAAGFVPKTAPVERLIRSIEEVARGRLAFSAEAMKTWSSAPGKGNGEPENVLSNRELEVFLLLGRGLSPQDIGDCLCIAMKTVYKHMANIKSKLSVPAGSGLTHFATMWVMERRAAS